MVASVGLPLAFDTGLISVNRPIHTCGAAAANGVRFCVRELACVNPYWQRVISFSAFLVSILGKKSHGAK